MTIKERIAEKVLEVIGVSQGICGHEPCTCYQTEVDHLTDFITTLLAEQKERIVEKVKKCFEEVEEREDRVEVNDIITLIKESN